MPHHGPITASRDGWLHPQAPMQGLLCAPRISALEQNEHSDRSREGNSNDGHVYADEGFTHGIWINPRSNLGHGLVLSPF